MTMRTITTKTYTLHGGICGDMWAGPAASLPISAPLARAALLPDELAATLFSDGGDFANPAFTADTYIEVQHSAYLVRERDDKISSEIHHVRLVALLDLPSVVSLVNPDVCTWDEEVA